MAIKGLPKQPELPDDKAITQKISAVLQDTAFILGIKQLPTLPAHSQCNVLTERFSRTLKTMLSKLIVNKGSDWDRLLELLLFIYQTSS